MSRSTLLREIQQETRRLADKDIAQHSRRFFKTGKGEYGAGDRFLGIRVPVLRKLARKYRGLDLVETERLLQSHYHEERLLALILLVNRYKKSDQAEQKRIYDLYLKNRACINNWDLVDTSAEHIVGGHLYEKSRAPLYKLSRSENLWDRRIAIMATFNFIKRLDFNDALKLSEALLEDKEDLLHKAVGWMLREIGNRDRAVEEQFLAKHYRTMPRTMLRYAIEKFPERTRQKYLKGQI